MANITIGRLKGGFCATWKDGVTGRRRRYQLKARTRADAEAEARDVYRRHTIPQAGLTVSDIWSAYRNDRDGRAVATTMGYTGKPVLAHFGALRPDQITTEDCRAYTSKRLAEGRKVGAIWTELGHLRTALVWAERVARCIPRAPHIERPPKPAPKDRFLTEAEIERLLDADAEPHIRLAIHLMLATGGRVGAILDLTWTRVDLERRQIDLRLPDDGPRKGRAVVPVNAGILAALQDARQAALTEYVVEWARKPVKSIRRGFQRAVDAAGLSGVTPHVLRHTAAVHMAAAGVEMRQISQFLGHSNTSVTERVYARYAPDHLREAANVVDFTRLRKVQ